MSSLVKKALFVVGGIVVLSSHAFAGDDVGKIVALRGKTSIERGGSTIEGKLKDGIQARDTVKTGPNSRAKLLFIDDSVLTVGDNSKVVVQEFIYAKGKEGKSLFNLMDGKMRTVVGKTKFEVQTPTAVAAARGTVIFFDVGVLHNEKYSKIICLEGHVQIRSILPSVSGSVTLSPGTMVIMKTGDAPPRPVNAPPAELEKARNATSRSGQTGTSLSAGSSNDSSAVPDPVKPGPEQPPKPPPQVFNQQPLVQPKNVTINITPSAQK